MADAFVHIWDNIVIYIGIPFSIIIFLYLSYGTLKILLKFGSNHLHGFFFVSKLMGMFVGLFGLLLIGRNFPLTTVAIEIWVATIMYQTFPVMQLLQGFIALSISYCIWITEIFNERTFIEIISDSVIFLAIPTVFILAQLNYESQSAVPSANPKFYGPRIHLSKYI